VVGTVVTVGVGDRVIVPVVGVAVMEIVMVGVGVIVAVSVPVVGVAVKVGERVSVSVGVVGNDVEVAVGVNLLVAVGVGDHEGVTVSVGVGVHDGEGVEVTVVRGAPTYSGVGGGAGWAPTRVAYSMKRASRTAPIPTAKCCCPIDFTCRLLADSLTKFPTETW
jgi:hypothetical protein